MYALITYIHCSSAKSSTGGQALVTNEVVQDLRQNIFKLEEEVSFFFTYYNDDQIHSYMVLHELISYFLKCKYHKWAKVIVEYDFISVVKGPGISSLYLPICTYL